ncbi:hypothetical protein [Tumebacillus flagellatus]|uniref:SAF domain-containing protein n=1 Tax=Tumebacillus flagellatus TaxID=1157490 RepID=A0A074LRX1_9BACL|nr:hypothetical protein [Tumebacillus flagellatus]KEO84896.1 hypothetical protein EL26_02475 [Tumebacillus flagellatus]
MKRTLLIVFCVSVGMGALGYTSWSQSTSSTVEAQPAPAMDDQTVKTIEVHGILPLKTKTDLIGESEVIVRGKVKDLLPSRWSNPNWERGQTIRNIVQTDVVVHVNQVYKGTPYDKDIAVRVDKGEVGNTVWKSEDEPDFTKGEDVILFLNQDNSDVARPEETYYVLSGMLQGKFSLDPKHPEDKRFHNDKESIDPASLTDEIPKEEEAYKKRPKPTPAKGDI